MHACQIFQVIQQQFWQPSFGSPVLATSLELIPAETKFSSLKTDVMMTANIRCSGLTFSLLIIIIFAILNQFYTQ